MGIERMTMDIREDLSKFNLSITAANEQCRKLIIDEAQQLNKLFAEMQAEKAIVDKDLLAHKAQIDEQASHLDKLDEQSALLKSTLTQLDKAKVEKAAFNEFLEANENKVLDLEDALTKHDNNIKSLENYVEKYVPNNTQNLIIENLKQFVSKDIISRLKSQSNKVQAELTASMLADNG